jgi:hypothetical protein
LGGLSLTAFAAGFATGWVRCEWGRKGGLREIKGWKEKRPGTYAPGPVKLKLDYFWPK